jgi:hypothetical protein
MTGTPELLKNLTPGFGRYVKFGDGKRSKVVGKGELVLEGFPIFRDVLLVDGLKTNLLSISHLCDSKMTVFFDKEKCIVNHGDGVFTGARSSDYCYLLDQEIKCSSSGLVDSNGTEEADPEVITPVVSTASIDVSPTYTPTNVSDEARVTTPASTEESRMAEEPVGEVITPTPVTAPVPHGMTLWDKPRARYERLNFLVQKVYCRGGATNLVQLH